VVPVIPAYFDTSAVDAVVDMCKRRKKPYAFVWSAYDKRKIFNEVNREALASLKGRGDIFEAHLQYHPNYRLSQIDGMAGPEKDAKLGPEVDALWGEVKTLAGFEQQPLKVVKGGKRG
jgi:hypothetical protein